MGTKGTEKPCLKKTNKKKSLKSYYLQAVAQVSSLGSYILLASEMTFYSHWQSSFGALNYNSAVLALFMWKL